MQIKRDDSLKNQFNYEDDMKKSLQELVKKIGFSHYFDKNEKISQDQISEYFNCTLKKDLKECIA